MANDAFRDLLVLQGSTVERPRRRPKTQRLEETFSAGIGPLRLLLNIGDDFRITHTTLGINDESD
jgi:hypothetical protein